MKDKMKWIITYVLLGAMVAGVTVTSVVSIRTMDKTETIAEKTNELDTKVENAVNQINTEFGGEDVLAEDNVLIGGEYLIESTTHISDAYKSGDTSALSDRDKETLDMAKAVIDDVIKDGMTPYEKELAIYEWMTKNLVFDEGSLVVIPTSDSDCDNPYGVLKNHNAVCVGYATTFRLFMQMMDIECMVVHDTGLSHSWDLVKLDDEWYHTDIYSDVGLGGYANFNMSDSLAQQNHDWNTSFFPAATGIKYNVGYQNRTTIKDVYDIPKFVHDIIESGESKSVFVELEGGFDNGKLIIAESMMSLISESMYYANEYEDTEFSYSWVQDGEENKYLSISVQNYQEVYDEIFDIDEEELQKIQDAVDEYFSIEYDDYFGDNEDSNFGFMDIKDGYKREPGFGKIAD